MPGPPESSPLARGLLAAGLVLDEWAWIIPARAGFTPFGPCGPAGPRDHPRSRRVYKVKGVAAKPVNGSSPLARGLQHHDCHRRHPRGIIPARAEFTTGSTRIWTSGPDHPRSRGVYLSDGAMRFLDEGSSPLARGLRHVPVGPRGPVGIIPARAGFTVGGVVHRRQDRDHPRSRGVYP